jgi:RNA polymerase sigma factor (sigma-70 family)
MNGAGRPLPEGAPRPGSKAGRLGRARRAVLSDDRLAKQAAAGDVGAFEAIFRRYQDDLYRFCVGILREPQDAQDALQNTMVKAMRALPGERRAMQLKPWLYRIAHNEAVELRRRERPVEELPETVDDIGSRTEERAEENGRLRALLADIADLPERQRASLVMREVNGLGFGEIGAALGTSPGAVRQALYEARRGLAEMDHGREMNCDLAARMVSDADGRPRDRGVRAHVRECSACRRLQVEIRERARTLAAISPMPAFAAVGALKAALGASGGVGAAGGAGAGAAGAGVTAGSVGAAAMLKPAAGVLAVLAIGTAAVDHGAIFDPGRHAPTTAGGAGHVPAPAKAGDRRTKTRPLDGLTRGRSAAVSPVARDVAGSRSSTGGPHAGGVANRRGPGRDAPETAAGPVMTGEEIGARAGAPHDRTLLDGAETPAAPPVHSEHQPASEAVSAPPPGHAKEESVTTGGATNESPPPGQAKKEDKESAPPGQAKKEGTPPGQATKESTAPGQAKKEGTPPSQTKKEGAPPGQAKKESSPPGQAKKEAESTPEAAPTESSAPPSTEVDKPAHVPPGQAKKETEATVETVASESSPAAVPTTEAPKVPPGQAKKEEAASE